MFEYRFATAHHLLIIYTNDNGSITSVHTFNLTNDQDQDGRQMLPIDVVAGFLIDLAENNRPILMLSANAETIGEGGCVETRVFGGDLRDYHREFLLVHGEGQK